jgi:hypothetical protein
MDDEFDYDEAMGILCSWEGRYVMVVAFVEPGVSLRPFGGILTIVDDDGGMLHAEVSPGPGTQSIRMAFNSGLFHDAGWVPGMEERGLSIEHGAIRVDVFLED